MTSTHDRAMLQRIHELVAEEHRLRDGSNGPRAQDDGLRRLRAVEETLDQCWDLLRQRQAREEFGQDPDVASVRPVSQVEGYLQ